jgi:hypothetical protein
MRLFRQEVPTSHGKQLVADENGRLVLSLVEGILPPIPQKLFHFGDSPTICKSLMQILVTFNFFFSPRAQDGLLAVVHRWLRRLSQRHESFNGGCLFLECAPSRVARGI